MNEKHGPPTQPVTAVETITASHAALTAALELGLLDALAGPSFRDAAEVARDDGLDARATRVLLEALVEVGVLERGPDGYRAHPDLPMLARRMTPALAHLSERVRTGETALAGDRPADAGQLYADLADLLRRIFARSRRRSRTFSPPRTST